MLIVRPIGRSSWYLQDQIRNLQDLDSAEDERSVIQKELDDLICLTMESPNSLAEKMEFLQLPYEEDENAKQ